MENLPLPQPATSSMEPLKNTERPAAHSPVLRVPFLESRAWEGLGRSGTKVPDVWGARGRLGISEAFEVQRLKSNKSQLGLDALLVDLQPCSLSKSMESKIW